MGTYAFFRGDAERQGLQPWNLEPPERSKVERNVCPGYKITCDARAGWQLFVASDEEYVEEGQRIVFFDFKGYVDGNGEPSGPSEPEQVGYRKIMPFTTVAELLADERGDTLPLSTDRV